MRKNTNLKISFSLIFLLVVVALPVMGVDVESEEKQKQNDKEQVELRELLENEKALQERTIFEELHSKERMTKVHELLFSQIDDSDEQIDLPTQLQDKQTSAILKYSERRKYLDQLRLLKLLEVLELREDQEMEFLSAFNNVRKEQRNLENELRSTSAELSKILKENVESEAEINLRIEKIIKSEKAKTENRIRFLEQIKKFLTAAQLGHFVIFQGSFEANLLKQVRGFHGRGPGPGRSRR